VSARVEQRRAGVWGEVLDGRNCRVVVVVVVVVIIIIIIISSSSMLPLTVSAPPSFTPRFFALGQAGKYTNAIVTHSNFVTFHIAGQPSVPETESAVRAHKPHCVT